MDDESIVSYRSVPVSGITGVVLTHNGERLLEKCLSSLFFCETLLVVDSGSTDETLAIAEKYDAEVVFHKWDGFASQFTYAHSLVRTRWFFILDQDEICPEELGEKILLAVSASDAEADSPGDSPIAFSVGRKSWYFDRFMQYSGWYPDHILRVFRKDFVEFYQDAHIHYRPLGRFEHVGAVGTEIIHYPYESFFHQLTKLNTYAEQGASFLRTTGKKGGLLRGVGHGIGRFLRLYFLKRGFLDGRAGFLVACHGAFYAFLKYARVFESSWGAPYDHDTREK